LGEEWAFIGDPERVVTETKGLVEMPIRGSKHTQEEIRKKNELLSNRRSQEVIDKTPAGENAWSRYPQNTLEPPLKKAG
jgi:Mn-containing catalase